MDLGSSLGLDYSLLLDHDETTAAKLGPFICARYWNTQKCYWIFFDVK